jgi:tetratricopeptide (TPR) repeat protein
MKRAQELDPLSPDANTSLAYVLYFARDFDGAIRYCERALALEPNVLEALLLLGLSYEQKGMFEEAIIQFNKANDIHRDSAEPLELLGHVFALTGHKDKARTVLSELDSFAKQKSLHPYNVALMPRSDKLSRPLIGFEDRTSIGRNV